MKLKIHLILFFLTGHVIAGCAQSKADDNVAKTIEILNQTIDNAVAQGDIATLEKHYAEDFVFTHGTGLVDSKESWIRNVKNLPEGDRYLYRQHDSTKVEVHKDVAIIHGKLSVSRQSKTIVSNYFVRYIRVYAMRNKVWQMISHRTYFEKHY